MASKKKDNLERFAPILVVVSIALAFAVGVLWQKVSNLESAGRGGATGGGQQAAPAGQQAPQVSKLDKDSLLSYAEELDLDMDDFESCVNDKRFANRVVEQMNEGQDVGVGGTPAFFLNGHFISGAQPYNVFEDAINYELAGGDWENLPEDLAYLTDGNPSNGEISAEVQDVAIADDIPVKGEANAPVTLIEYSDFECPYCTSFFTQTLSQIQENFIDTGDVKLAYKHFPLISIHPNAQPAAEASECAREQGKFWEYHDMLFGG